MKKRALPVGFLALTASAIIVGCGGSTSLEERHLAASINRICRQMERPGRPLSITKHSTLMREYVALLVAHRDLPGVARLQRDGGALQEADLIPSGAISEQLESKIESHKQALEARLRADATSLGITSCIAPVSTRGTSWSP